MRSSEGVIWDGRDKFAPALLRKGSETVRKDIHTAKEVVLEFAIPVSAQI